MENLFYQDLVFAFNAGSDFLPTLNRKGYSSLFLDNFTLDFGNFVKHCKKPILEIGSGYGFAAKYFLQMGVKSLIVNDLEKEHLRFFWERISENERKRVIIKEGSCLESLDFPENSLDGVFCSNCFNFLTGEEIEIMIEKIYKWLAVYGKFVLILTSPFFVALESFFKIYENLKSQHRPWPGMIFDFRNRFVPNWEAAPDFYHVLEPAIINRSLRKQPFSFEKVSFIEKPFFPFYFKLDGRENFGIVLIKKLPDKIILK